MKEAGFGIKQQADVMEQIDGLPLDVQQKMVDYNVFSIAAYAEEAGSPFQTSDLVVDDWHEKTSD